MSGKTLRLLLRWTHIIAALLLGTYLYSPWIPGGLAKVVLVPLLVLTGIAMWKQGKVANWLRAPGVSAPGKQR